MNELIVMSFFGISFGSIYLLYKYFQKEGLYFYLVISTIFLIISSVKLGPFLGFDININIPIFTGILATFYILLEKEKKHLKEIFTYVSFISLLTAIILIILSLYVPSITSSYNYAFKDAFLNNYRSLFMSSICLISNIYLITKIYPKIKKEFESYFISIALISITLGLVNSFIFAFTCYLGVLDISLIIKLVFSNYIISLLFSSLYIPVILLINKIKKVKKNA